MHLSSEQSQPKKCHDFRDGACINWARKVSASPRVLLFVRKSRVFSTGVCRKLRILKRVQLSQKRVVQKSPISNWYHEIMSRIFRSKFDVWSTVNDRHLLITAHSWTWRSALSRNKMNLDWFLYWYHLIVSLLCEPRMPNREASVPKLDLRVEWKHTMRSKHTGTV